MFDATINTIEPNRITRYTLTRNAAALSFSEVLDLWQSDSDFRNYFTQLLTDSPFAAYRWETPALTTSSATQAFQFVLLNAPGFCARKTDEDAYNNYFTADDTDHGVVSFANLGGDASLVVPSPRTTVEAYGHLAAFIRHAPKAQLDAFWRIVSNCVKARIGNSPLWLSTAGGGVAWVHVRIDSRPKYYGYSPYRTV
jgi:hypothetical protein